MKRQAKATLNGHAQEQAVDPRIELALNQLLAYNATTMSREALMRKLFDARRDIDDECGYPKTLDAYDYRRAFDRDAIARRVVEVLAKESWQKAPSVYEEEDAEVETDFEIAWDQLGQSLRGDSKFKEEEGSPVWDYLLRADIMSGVGAYGVLLLGIDDGRELSQPVAGVVKFPELPMGGTSEQYYVNNVYGEPDPKTGKKELIKSEKIPIEQSKPEEEQPKTVETKRKLLFMRVFDQSTAQIIQWETNPQSPRFGMPKMYLLTFNDPSSEDIVASGALSTKQVHWSRVIHIADNLTTSEVAGDPRLKPVWNRVYDLMKVYGGGGEGYWRGSYNGLSFETHPQLGPNFPIDIDAMKDKIEQYRNGLQRDLWTAGMTAKSIAPNVLDPTPWIKVYLEAICIRIGVPMRVFLGSERGELASSQDDSTWNDRLDHRRQFHITPRIIVPFVDRLILIGVLPEPAEGYCTRWPDLNTVQPVQQADVALKKTQALAAYVAGNVEAVIPPMEYLTKILYLSDEEAEDILEKASEAMEDDRMTPDPEVQRQEDAEMAAEQFGQQTELQKAALGMKAKAGAPA